MKVYIGIDWSENKHDLCFMHASGEVLLTLQIQHIITGFRELDQARQSLGVEKQEVTIGLETAHNLFEFSLLPISEMHQIMNRTLGIEQL